MKKTLIALAALAACAGITTRARTHDVAFTYRMGGGFPGDVNRTHPASILPGLMNATTPVRLYGDPVLVNQADNTVRGFAASDLGAIAPTQAALATSTSGGTGLAATTAYYYVVTALTALGESTRSNEQTVTTGAGATNSNTVSWAAVPNATGYKVYRGTQPGGELQYYTVGAVTSYVDTGAAVSGQGTPPAVNTTYPNKIAGIAVRPFPVQQQSGNMSAALGAATPPTSGVFDYLNDGFIIAKCNNFGANPSTKGGAVHIWVAASSGNHVQGGFEAAATAGSTIPVANAFWNGPPDANGVTEIQVFPAQS